MPYPPTVPVPPPRAVTRKEFNHAVNAIHELRTPLPAPTPEHVPTARSDGGTQAKRQTAALVGTAHRPLTRAERESARKRLMADRGLCRQCGSRRGKSPSRSRCSKCVEKARKQQRRRHKGRPYRKGKAGRPPMPL